jgi:hypothetical protein
VLSFYAGQGRQPSPTETDRPIVGIKINEHPRAAARGVPQIRPRPRPSRCFGHGTPLPRGPQKQQVI